MLHDYFFAVSWILVFAKINSSKMQLCEFKNKKEIFVSSGRYSKSGKINHPGNWSIESILLAVLSRWYLRSKETSKAFGTQISFIDTDAFLSNKRKKYCSMSFNDVAFKTLWKHRYLKRI